MTHTHKIRNDPYHVITTFDMWMFNFWYFGFEKLFFFCNNTTLSLFINFCAYNWDLRYLIHNTHLYFSNSTKVATLSTPTFFFVVLFIFIIRYFTTYTFLVIDFVELLYLYILLSLFENNWKLKINT